MCSFSQERSARIAGRNSKKRSATTVVKRSSKKMLTADAVEKASPDGVFCHNLSQKEVKRLKEEVETMVLDERSFVQNDDKVQLGDTMYFI